MVIAVGGQESKPRTTKCFFTYRDNIPSDDIKDNWRRATDVPFMDNLIAQLESRLGDRQHTDLFIVFPSVMMKCDSRVYERRISIFLFNLIFF